MRLLPKWALTDKTPAFYDAESSTAIEMVAKVYGAMQEFITEYNKFSDDINAAWEEYKNNTDASALEFQMKMEQLYSDFVKVIEMKYQSQDAYLQQAVDAIIAGIPDALAKALDQLYANGEFDIIVYNSIANLKADFDKIVNSTNTFQSNINKSFSNLVTDMETFKSNTTSEFNTLEENLNQRFNELVLENASADMQKAIYDTDNSGVVDNAERLAGQLPTYYAKQQDLDTTNVALETANVALNSAIKQIETVQTTANLAKTTAETAKTTADSALSKANSKLDAGATAVDSNKLGGKDASDYAPAANGITIYTHAKTGVIHHINGSGNNIKFVATADFKAGDSFYVNGTEVTARTAGGKALPAGMFTSGNVVTCYLNGTVLNFNSGGAGGLNFSVVNGTTQPASPSENTIWVNTSTAITKWNIVSSAPTAAGSSGDVAIVAKLEAGFNAVEGDNTMYINPAKAYQYISGAWVQKDLMYYMNGKWYSNALAFTADNWAIVQNANVTALASGVHIECSSGGSSYALAYIKDAADLTDVSSITIDVSAVNGNMGSGFHTYILMSKEKPTGNIYGPGDYGVTVTGKNTYTIKTEAASGDYYLVVQPGYQVGTYIEISDIQLK